jgi:transposase
MKIVKAMCDGEVRANELEKLVHGRIRNKHKEKIYHSLQGVVRPCDRLLLKQSYQQYQLVKEQQNELIEQMNRICHDHFEKEMKALGTIPGVNTLSSMTMLAEIGNDMASFPTDKHLVSWAGLRPRNDESAGKIKSKKVTHGNKYLRRIMVQCAWAASRTKGSWFQGKFQQLCVRKSEKKALIAIARKQLMIIYHLMQTKQDYVAPVQLMTAKQRQRRINYYQRQLDALLNMG